MTKVPWKGRETSLDHQVFVVTKAGQCVSVDQLISMQVGFIPQLKATLTKKRYTMATVFVDHYSKLKYIHLMSKLTSEETMEAKHVFEHFTNQHSIRILHYHCNNGQFADNAFKNSCSAKGQRLTFCGVNTHFQNSIAEKSIWDLRKSARKQLLHVRQQWLATIHLALWPYALRNAVYLHNTLSVLEDGTSRLECFSSIRTGSKMKHHHAVVCPVFALENNLAAGNLIPHWSPHTCLGVDLGPSPLHARNIYLILNLHKGCVSPQYHCRFDNFFDMVRHGGPDISVASAWQQLSGLTVMSQTPSMEYHKEVPRPSERMQFGNNPIAPTQETDNTISFGGTPDTPIFFDQHMQDFSDYQSVATVNEGETASHQPLQDSAVLPSVSIGAGTSLQGRVCKMSRTMAESVSQCDFFGKDKMHYMASQAVYEHDYKSLHNSHLDLQECMHHPIPFLAEMMRDILY
jgi:hypothetical protein